MATVTLVNGTTTHAFDFVGDYTQSDFKLPRERPRRSPTLDATAANWARQHRPIACIFCAQLSPLAEDRFLELTVRS